jgi:integrase
MVTVDAIAEAAPQLKHKPRAETGVYQRPGSQHWWVRYYVHGKLVRESARTANFEAAVKLRRKRLADTEDGKTVGPSIARVRFDDLKKNLINEYELKGRKPKNVKRLKQAFNNLERKFANWRAIDITSGDIKSYAVERQKAGAAPATVNRELAVLRRAFNLAIEDGELATAPHIKTPEVKNAREGFVEAAVFEKLVAALPERYRDPIRFLWATGWRVGEMRSLVWKNIYNDAIRLPGVDSKNTDAREIPLEGDVAEIIKRARSRRRLDCQLVFFYVTWSRKLKRENVRPIGDIRKSWDKARKAVGLGPSAPDARDGLIKHDLRRSAVRDLIESEVPDKVAMEITGHKTRAIFDRYHIVRSKEKKRGLITVKAYRAAQIAAAGAQSGAQSHA